MPAAAPRSLANNSLEGSGEAMGEALKANSSLKALFMNICDLGPEDGKGLAAGVAASASLTKVRAACAPLALYASDRVLLPAQLDVMYNSLGDEGEAAIKEAVRGKEGFELGINTY